MFPLRIDGEPLGRSSQPIRVVVYHHVLTHILPPKTNNTLPNATVSGSGGGGSPSRPPSSKCSYEIKTRSLRQRLSLTTEHVEQISVHHSCVTVSAGRNAHLLSVVLRDL